MYQIQHGFLEELHFIYFETHSIGIDVFKKHNHQFSQLFINELSLAISTNNPLEESIAKGGPLSSAFKHKQFYKQILRLWNPLSVYGGKLNFSLFKSLHKSSHIQVSTAAIHPVTAT